MDNLLDLLWQMISIGWAIWALDAIQQIKRDVRELKEDMYERQYKDKHRRTAGRQTGGAVTARTAQAQEQGEEGVVGEGVGGTKAEM